MKTPLDLISLIIFAGLAVLYLQRSASEQPDEVAIWKYAVAAIGCATADVAGNHGYPIVGYLGVAATAAFAFLVLKPFARNT